jgi:hypothetical protein
LPSNAGRLTATVARPAALAVPAVAAGWPWARTETPEPPTGTHAEDRLTEAEVAFGSW